MSPVLDQPQMQPPGWNNHWAQEWSTSQADGLIPCRVVRIDKGGIMAATSSGEEHLVVAAKAVRRVVVGDLCGLDLAAGRIELILPRRYRIRTPLPRRCSGPAATAVPAARCQYGSSLRAATTRVGGQSDAISSRVGPGLGKRGAARGDSHQSRPCVSGMGREGAIRGSKVCTLESRCM